MWGATREINPELLCKMTPVGIRRSWLSLASEDFGLRCNLRKRLKPHAVEVLMDYASTRRDENIMGFEHVYPGDTLELMYLNGMHLYNDGMHVRAGQVIMCRVTESVQGMYVYRGKRYIDETCGVFRAQIVSIPSQFFNPKTRPDLLHPPVRDFLGPSLIFGPEERLDLAGSLLEDDPETTHSLLLHGGGLEDEFKHQRTNQEVRDRAAAGVWE